MGSILSRNEPSENHGTIQLAPSGGESSDPTPVRGDVAADRGAAGPGRLTRSEYNEAHAGEERTQMRSGV